MAQAFSSFDTYLAPFIKVDGLTYKEVKQCIQSFIYGVNTPSRWGCCPITTKVATPNGFKSVDELKVGDIIYTWLNGTLHEAPLDHIIRRKNDFEVLHRYGGVNYVQTVTPEHRCIVELGSKRGRYTIKQSMDVFKQRNDMRMPMCIQDVDVAYNDAYSDDEIMLAAMLYTDGSDDLDDIRITKSFLRDTGMISSVLDRIGLTYSVYENKERNGNNMARTYRISNQHKKYIADLIGSKYHINPDFTHLNKEQSLLFVRTWASFDGSVDGRLSCQYDNEEIKDALELIMMRAGYMSHTWSRKKESDKNATNYLYADNRMSVVINSQEEIPYDGEVWCPNTKDGTAIFKDEDGNVFISGNCQAPFTNITLDWTVPNDLAELNCIVGGKEMDFCYKDCKAEMDMINKAFIEVMIEGDANGRGFQYPIPTYSITKDFDWSETENARLLFEMTAKYGTPYFSNYINSDMEPSDVRSMCCRLRLDLRELRKKSGGFFGSGESTGSVGVVTINMPRIAYLSENEKEFYHRLDRMMDISARSLKMKRDFITKLLDDGLYPYTKRYLGTFNNHFSTIGLVGMNEAGLNAKWIRKDMTHEECQKFTIDVLNHMRDRLSDYQEKYGDLYNLEATPAESTAYRLAKHDKKKYPDIITANEGADATPYYTNSSHLPVGYTEDIFSALDIQDELQTLYTSGTVFHAFLGEKLPDWKAAASLVRKIAENYKLPYYTLSPTYSVCKEHGYIPGEQYVCPACGSKTEVYSRITGYYRPVQNWNDGKTQEFHDRKTYEVDIAKIAPSDNQREETTEHVDASTTSTESVVSILFATPTCPNCKIACVALDNAGYAYEKIYATEYPDKAKEYGIKQAPTLVVVSATGMTKYCGVSEIKRYLLSL